MIQRWMFPAFLVFLFACSSPPPDAPVVRLVDVFDEATVEGSSTERGELPRTEWRFDRGEHRWKAGPGVSGLTVREGRLVGRATTDVPIVHVERTSGLENPDTLHAVEVRMRVSKGSNLSMELIGSESIDYEATTRSAAYWSIKSPILPSEEAPDLYGGSERFDRSKRGRSQLARHQLPQLEDSPRSAATDR